jgi:hypothetical protein
MREFLPPAFYLRIFQPVPKKFLSSSFWDSDGFGLLKAPSRFDLAYSMPLDVQHSSIMKPAPSRRRLMAGLLAFVVPFAGGRADVHRYRYELTGRSGEPRFAVELPPDRSPSGPWYEVERDSLTRLARVAELRGAMKENETVYHYLGKTLFSDSADTYQLGEHTGLLKYQRNEKGYLIRTDGFTVSGELTGYSIRRK